MALKDVVQSVKGYIIKSKRNIPYKIDRNNDGITIKRVDNRFNPKNNEQEDRIYLVILEGQDTVIKEVKKHGDDMTLEYGDKVCAITSQPLLVGGSQFYFTKHGFLGTMALNKDTLLAGDVYQPSMDSKERKISKDIDLDKLDFDIEDKAVKEEDDHFVVENSELGDVATLHGSKKTLKEMNKAKRIRKLLQPTKMDKKMIIAYIGLGTAIGMYLYPNVM